MSCGMCTRITNEPQATSALASGTKLKRQQLPVKQYIFLTNYMSVLLHFFCPNLEDEMYVNKALNYSGFVNTCWVFFFFLMRGIKTIGIANFISTTIAPTNHCKCRKSGGGNGMEKNRRWRYYRKAQGCWPIRSQKISKLG